MAARPAAPIWRKSSHSTTECVEIAHMASTVAVRDSKLDTTGQFPMLSMSMTEWSGLLQTIRSGTFHG